MLLVFDRRSAALLVLPERGRGTPTFWPAANNASSTSRGPWPAGVFDAEKLMSVDGPGGDPSGAYGRLFLRFVVPDRDGVPDAVDLGGDGLPDAVDGAGIGLGIHAGRLGMPDGRGREGHRHATMGCIRTTDAAMAEIERHWDSAGRCRLWVVD
jgi:hypothetical protein